MLPASAQWIALLFACAIGARGAVSFQNDVMPVLSKAGCNAGPCHGNANGKAGFKLSLRGESPELDFRALSHDQFGRRLNSLDPDQSLILLKPTAQISHEGGQRFKRDSAAYQTLRAWIAEGHKADPPETPKLVRLEAAPKEKILIEPERSVQIAARAFFSDGTSRDVTSLAVYEASAELLKISAEGFVEAERACEGTVLVRFLTAQVPVKLAFVPARPEFRWSAPASRNHIDQQVFAKLKALRTNPSPICSDEIFARRAYLDLLGILPTAEEAKRFVSEKGRNKRSRLVDGLLERPEFADFWALKWSDLLRNEERLLDRKGVEAFHHWVRQSLAENKPLDQFARELLSARGSTYQNPAANYYRANREPTERSVAAAQVFLGLRLQCAQCHNHPFDRWSQDDYYDWAEAFARVKYKVLENRRRDNNDGHEFKGEQIVFVSPSGGMKNPRTGKPARLRFLLENEARGDADPLAALGRWLTAPENPFFARTQANRIWYHLLGRGLVDPIDDFRASNPPSHPGLLDMLAADFVRHRYDLRQMIKLIMDSTVYQLSSEPNETNGADETNFSHNQVRRLGAEQLLDCQSEACGAPVQFPGYPAGLRAAQLPGALGERKRDQKQMELDHFLETFGKPARLLTTECERSCEPTMAQAFQLISGPALNDLLTRKPNRLDELLGAKKQPSEIIQELYWSALTRAPRPEELARAESFLAKAKSPREGLEDLVWTLVNAKEFILRK